MNWVVDEGMQHRLIGAGILLVLAAILMPALMNRAHDIYEHGEIDVISPVSKHIPVQKMPSTEATEFTSQSLAHVDLQHASAVKPKSEDLHAVAIVAKSSAQVVSHQKQVIVAHAKKLVKPERPRLLATAQTKVVVRAVNPKAKFTVQLASFANLANAEALIAQLKRQGYVATYQRVMVNNVAMFKVMVGQVADKAQAQNLQTRLAQTNKLKGMIVTIGVS